MRGEAKRHKASSAAEPSGGRLPPSENDEGISESYLTLFLLKYLCNNCGGMFVPLDHEDGEAGGNNGHLEAKCNVCFATRSIGMRPTPRRQRRGHRVIAQI